MREDFQFLWRQQKKPNTEPINWTFWIDDQEPNQVRYWSQIKELIGIHFAMFHFIVLCGFSLSIKCCNALFFSEPVHFLPITHEIMSMCALEHGVDGAINVELLHKSRFIWSQDISNFILIRPLYLKLQWNISNNSKICISKTFNLQRWMFFTFFWCMQ